MKRKLFYQPSRFRQVYVTGTSVHNYLNNDAIVDVFSKRRKINTNDTYMTNFLQNKGNNFENSIVTYIKSLNIPIKTISNLITTESLEQTEKSMKEGFPIIHSAPLCNEQLKLKGIADLLVRSDYMNKLFNQPKVFLHGSNINSNYHYVVVDVKFSTLPLRSDGIHLQNAGRYKGYKGQLYIYNKLLGCLQGFVPPYAYILGRRSTYTYQGVKYDSQSCFDKIGLVDFRGQDSEYIDKTESAIVWLNQVNNEQTKLDFTELNLTPNLSIDSGKWNKQKQELAIQNCDISQIWQCGIKAKTIAFSKGIRSWTDNRCSSFNLGFRGQRAKIIDAIIDINRQSKDLIRPSRIVSSLFNWRSEQNELYVDFETIADVYCEDVPEQTNTDRLFMIGIYDGDQYINFTCTTLSDSEEFRIMSEFIAYINFRQSRKLWFWSAEDKIWSRAETRLSEKSALYRDYFTDNVIRGWADLSMLFKTEPIVLKGCFKFGLKEISRVMKQHGMIKTYFDSQCQSGLEASHKAWQVYKSGVNIENSDVMADICKYNRIDVVVMVEILDYLRRNR